MRKSVSLLVVTLSIAAVSLTACKKGGGDNSTVNGAAAIGTDGKPVPTAERDGTKKFNSYTEAYNDLIKDLPWNLPNIHREWEEFDLSKKRTGDTISYPESLSLARNAVKNLREGRAAASPDSAEGDAAADRLIKGLDGLIQEWSVLDPYFDAREYRGDNFAKARDAQPRVAAAYADAMAGLAAMDRALTTHQRKVQLGEIERFRRAGNAGGVAATQAMLDANSFFETLHAKNIDATAAQVDRIKADGDALRAASAALPDSDSNKSYLETMAGHLSDMVGDFRDYQQSKETSDLNDAIDSFNDVVEDSNRLEWTNN